MKMNSVHPEMAPFPLIRGKMPLPLWEWLFSRLSQKLLWLSRPSHDKDPVRLPPRWAGLRIYFFKIKELSLLTHEKNPHFRIGN
jgi:hypothetical protein